MSDIPIIYWSDQPKNKYQRALHPQMMQSGGLMLFDTKKNVMWHYDQNYVLSKLQAELIQPFSGLYSEDDLSDLIRMAYRTIDTHYLKFTGYPAFCQVKSQQQLLGEGLPNEF